MIITDRPCGICPSTFFQMMVGSGSPVARQWKNTSEFSCTSLSFGPSTIRGFSVTASPAFVNYFWEVSEQLSESYKKLSNIVKQTNINMAMLLIVLVFLVLVNLVRDRSLHFD